MATIKIKASKAFVEKKIVVQGIKDTISIGIRAYQRDELEPIKDSYFSTFDTTKLTRLREELATLTKATDLSDEEFSAKHDELTNSIKEADKAFALSQEEFCATHIVYIKGASIIIVDDNDIEKELLIADTRTALPIESLWSSPDECLAVLLDSYLLSPLYRDSLYGETVSAVFSTNFKAEELKN